jgi:hypothetical protein
MPLLRGSIAFLLIQSASVYALEAPLALPAAAKAYLPAGWKVIKLVQGDLNADGVADLAFVREETDPKKITKRDDGYEFNGNPRTFVVLLADKEGYRKVGEYPKFIPPAYTFEFDNYLDRFNQLKIVKGVITIEFDWFASAGTWWTSHDAFKFRLEAGKLRLIGREESSFARNEGDMTLTSTNHLTGKRKITTGISAFDDQPYRPKISWEDLESRKPVYLEDLPPCGRKD